GWLQKRPPAAARFLSRRALPNRLFLLQTPGTGQNAGQRVIALVTRRLKNLVGLLVRLRVRHLDGPRFGEGRRIVNRHTIENHVGRGSRETLDEVQRFAGSLVVGL